MAVQMMSSAPDLIGGARVEVRVLNLGRDAVVGTNYDLDWHAAAARPQQLGGARVSARKLPATCIHGNFAYCGQCYHALRHPFGAADRAMLLK